MSRVDRYVDHPVCANGHDLSSLRSYTRTGQGRRCKRCAEQRAQARKDVRRLALRPRTSEHEQRLRRRREKRRADIDRMRMQMLGCVESIRITTEQAKARKAA